MTETASKKYSLVIATSMGIRLTPVDAQPFHCSDGFVGGLLYGILKGWDVQKCARFGWASGALATTMLTDYAQPADEEQLWSIWKGNARVQR